MDFVAIDFETANADMSSICQIGLVKVQDGAFIDEWKSYVDPEDDFDDTNIIIHKIDLSMVNGAPTFPQLHRTLHKYLHKSVVVCHTHFDRVALYRVSQKYEVNMPECIWLDSAMVARRAWKQFAWKGYGLYPVSKMLGYEFRHHDALEDAKAAAHIILEASKELGMDLDSLFKRVEKSIGVPRSSIPVKRKVVKFEANPDGELYGEILCFTGQLKMPREEANELASMMGCRVSSCISKKTTMLVVGDQDIRKLAGHKKSSKHRKAEELLMQGLPIRIIKETDFQELVRSFRKPG